MVKLHKPKQRYRRRSKPFPILRLPRELRDQIYEYLVCPAAADVELDWTFFNMDAHPTMIRYLGHKHPRPVLWLTSASLHYVSNAQESTPQIAWVNRQINDEVFRMILVKARIWTRRSAYMLLDFLGGLPVDFLSLIRVLSISFATLPRSDCMSAWKLDGQSDWNGIISIMAKHMQLREVTVDCIMPEYRSRLTEPFPPLFPTHHVMKVSVNALKSFCDLLAGKRLDTLKVRVFEPADIHRCLRQLAESSYEPQLGECSRKKAMKRGLLMLEHLHWLEKMKPKLGLVYEILVESDCQQECPYCGTYHRKRHQRRYLLLRRRNTAELG